ncbi:MAG: leucyl/phenylalanyl-tRNA--protein transferase [Acidimicrobiales bacterium]|nr:leucyl/phenylalanyl-tRNA--protein transferase [Acidimicrobiales bacterium]
MPVEPPASPWRLPDPTDADEHGVVGVGADLEPGTLLQAYRSGLFPMPLGDQGPMAWWAPESRAVLPLDGLVVGRSLRRSCRRYEVRVDQAFDAVVAGCADPSRTGGWITPEIRRAYGQLHELGWAHSVEAWDDDGLAGGLYGVAIAGLFAGESMFHVRADASKVALVALVERLRADGDTRRLLDVQWRTDHLASLGAVEVPRRRYSELLALAMEAPLPTIWASGSPM